MTTINTEEPTYQSYQYMLGKTIHNGFLVPLLENIAGGLGVFMAVMGAYTLITAIMQERLTIWLFALTLALVIAGGFTAIRFFRDEWRMWTTPSAWQKVVAERDQLMHQVTALSDKLREVGEDTRDMQAFAAVFHAQRLAKEALAGVNIARADSLARGWKRADWEDAVRELRVAKCIDHKGKLTKGSYGEIVAALSEQHATQGMGAYQRAPSGGFVKQ